MDTLQVPVLGFDIGFGAGKAFTMLQSGSKDKSVFEEHSAVIPFVIATYDGRTLDGMGGAYRIATRPDVLRVDGAQYLVGPGAEKYSATLLEAGDIERLSGPEASLMVYATWAKLFGEQCEVEIEQFVGGLPLAVYQTENTRAIRDAVRNRFVGEHTFRFNDLAYRVKVNKVGVVPQALGAIADYTQVDGAAEVMAQRDMIGVVSLGNRTIDMALLQGTEILPVGTAGEPLGVRTLLEQVQSHMPGYSLSELDQRLRAGKLACTEEKALWLRQVADMVNRRWGTVKERLGRVVLVGGGVYLLPNREGTKNVASIGLSAAVTHIPDDPVLSVARGLFKIGSGKAK